MRTSREFLPRGVSRGRLALTMASRVLSLVSFLGLAGLAPAGPASAAPVASKSVQIVWSTYLRSGPGVNYGVIDELQHDTWIDLIGCADRWCKVGAGRVVGFVDRDAIALPRLPNGAAAQGGKQTCFIAGQQAWRGEESTRFCATHPGS